MNFITFKQLKIKTIINYSCNKYKLFFYSYMYMRKKKLTCKLHFKKMRVFKSIYNTNII